MNPENKPHFFKLNFQNLIQHELRIPPKFVKNYLAEVELPCRVTVKGPSGDLWPVEIIRKVTGLYLEDGWSKFTEDNSIIDNEFLLFKYDGDMCFTVHIFDKNECERVSETRPPPATVAPPQGTQTEASSSMDIYFMYCLGRSQVQLPFLLPIPKEFSKNLFAALTGKMIILRNSNGKTWGVKCLANGGRFILSAGWHNFVQDNNLRLNQNCVFQLVNENEMQVHIND